MPATNNLDNHYKGDTWSGISSITVNMDGSPLDLSGAAIRMQLRKTKNSPIFQLEWSTSDNTIVMLDAPNGVFQVVGRVVDVEAGVYYYDIEVTLQSGRIITIMDGSWEIEQDVTR